MGGDVVALVLTAPRRCRRAFGAPVLLLVLLLNCWSCQQPVEGCLDFRALSVNVAADEPCDGCCVYPGLQLAFVPATIDTLADTVQQVLTRSSTYVRTPGDTVTLERLLFYLSDLELVTVSGQSVPLLDTFSFRQNPSAPFVVAEQSLLRVAPFLATQLSTGQLLDAQQYVALQGRLGIPTAFAAAVPADLNSFARFALGQDSINFDTLNGRYRSAYLRRQSTLSGTEVVTVAGGDTAPFRLNFPEPITVPRSYNLNLIIALPVTELIDLPTGELAAGTFVAAALAKSISAEISVSR